MGRTYRPAAPFGGWVRAAPTWPPIHQAERTYPRGGQYKQDVSH
jgi:hypothetical protein